jgi:ketosteroid isomerase-like protein
MKVVLSAGLSLIVGLIVGALWIGPDRVGGLAESDVAVLSEAIGEVNQAFLAMDWATVVGHYQDDAVLMPPNGPAFSEREKLRSLLEAMPRISGLDSAIDDIGGCREVAFVQSHFSLTVEPEGLPPMNEAGKWVQIWRRQPDNTWRVGVEIWNSDHPDAAGQGSGT